MNEITLDRGTWFFDPSRQLGKNGSFGSVFAGHGGPNNEEIAVKRLHADVIVAREIEIANFLVGSAFEHVIPVLDAGLDRGSSTFFIVMAVASKNLAELLKAGPLTSEDATEVLLSIAKGLREVGTIVHRDLKPANVLLHNGKWRLADFGIAKFADESTATQTLKAYKSKPYAAPEQWTGDRVTQAADVYALGCIGYTLLTGRPPFNGDGLKEKHLTQTPTQLDCEPTLATLLAALLRKQPSTRPPIDRVIRTLENARYADGRSKAANSLASVAASIARHQAEVEANSEFQISRTRTRSEISSFAYGELLNIATLTCEQGLDAAANAECTDNSKPKGSIRSISLKLGSAQLEIQWEPNHTVAENIFADVKWEVVAAGVVGVSQSEPQFEWWHSLWYADLGPGDGFRWYEVGYMTNPLSRSRRAFEPFQLSTDASAAASAHAPALGKLQVAYGPTAIDEESSNLFVERWLNRLALAASGKLSRPSSLPLPKE